ncbi:11683_t:CDS:1, partial [Racocetra persica]
SKRTSIAVGKKKLEQAEKDLENGKKEVKLEVNDDEENKQIEL